MCEMRLSAMGERCLSISSEMQTGSSNIVQPIKDEYISEEGREFINTVASTMIECELKDDGTDVSTGSEDGFRVGDCSSVLNVSNELRNDNSITQLDSDLKDVEVGDVEEVLGDIPVNEEHLDSSVDIKQEPVKPEFVSVNVDEMRIKKEADPVASPDPFKGLDVDSESHELQEHPAEPLNNETCTRPTPSISNNVLVDIQKALACDCEKPCKHSRYNKNTRPELSLDTQQHSDYQEPYECGSCGKTYKVKESLQDHVSSDCGRLKPHKCDSCDKNFSSTKSLSQHKRYDCGCQEQKCESCGKTFKFRQSLRDHVRSDCNRSKHKCVSCGRAFSLLRKLRQHMRNDCNRKEPHKCQSCGKTYTLMDSLLYHVKSECSGVKSHKCGSCDMTFSTLAKLIYHRKHKCDCRQKSQQENKCEVCGKVYKWKHTLQEHRKSVCCRLNPLKCESCGKTFSWLSNLKYHLNHYCCNREPHI